MRVDPILTTYPTRVRYVSIGVLLAISMIFYGYPRALGEAEKIEFIIQEDIEMIDIPITEKPKEQKAPPKPYLKTFQQGLNPVNTLRKTCHFAMRSDDCLN